MPDTEVNQQDYPQPRSQAPGVDFRRGQQLGREDHVVPWTKPVRLAWMDEVTYAALPATIEMRELRVQFPQRGLGTRVVLVATTWRNAKVFAKEPVIA